jgi:DNA polymerase-3 subunit epsilon/ATP-dependent DNA helicase DinG
VDLAGEALQALVLARLPFDVPTDPVFAARCEQYEEPFVQYAVPRAVLRFRQGFGRLIRGEGDRGVVVILDKRVVSRNYGSLFLNSLPSCAIKRVNINSLARLVGEWLRG